MTRARFTGHNITLEQYRQLETEGRITRPITDNDIGVNTASQRAATANISAAFTEPDTPIPGRLLNPKRNRT